MSRLSHTRKPPRRRSASPGSTRNAGGRSSRRARPLTDEESARNALRFRFIVAKYPGKCNKCGELIPAGTRCSWLRGRGLWHFKADCGAGADAAIDAEVRAAQLGHATYTDNLGRTLEVSPLARAVAAEINAAEAF